MTFYEPAEDSYLMVECIKKYGLPSVTDILDVGVGSGILTKAVAQEYSNAKIVGIDINQDALTYATQHNFIKNITFNQQSFEEVTQMFDFIICNPPYLPANKNDPDDILNKALVGGKKGYEYVIDLIKHCKHILRANGHLYLLISSLTQPAIVEDFLDKELFVYKRLEKKYMGMMEELYVYDITHNPVHQAGVEFITFLAKGKRGVVLKGIYEDKPVTIKVVRPDSDASLTIVKEAQQTQKANTIGVGPQYITHKDNYIIREYIEGERIETWMEHASAEQKKDIFLQVLNQCFQLDQANLDKSEMTNPYKHILITPDQKAVQIDFERMNINFSPQNVTQFIQYISKMSPELKPVNDEQFKNAQKEYKKNKSQVCFEKILTFLQ